MSTNKEAVNESKEEGDDIIMDDPDRHPQPVRVMTLEELTGNNVNADSHPKSHSESVIGLQSNSGIGINKVSSITSPKVKLIKDELNLMHSFEPSKEFISDEFISKLFQPNDNGSIAQDPTEKSCTKLKQPEKRKGSTLEEECETNTEPTPIEMRINKQSPMLNVDLIPKMKRGKTAQASGSKTVAVYREVVDEIGRAPDNGTESEVNQAFRKALGLMNPMAYSNSVAGPSSAMEVEASIKDDETTETTFLGPCHHSSSRFVNGKCQMPCGAQLECGDMCSGTCGTCFHGRIHQLCEDPCGKELICGHTCESSCKDYCTPCLKPCPIFCPHGPCPLTCSEPCRPCEEPCGWKCPHLSCSRKCGEECDRRLCKERCPRKLFCGHDCVGICGEPCPPCRTCRPESFPRIFQTEEEEDDEKGKPRSRYILLMCGHSVEITGLIKWWSSPEVQDENLQNKQHQQVSMARCPSCRKVQTCRYLPTVRSTLRLIQLGKTELWWGRVDALEQELVTTLDEIRAEMNQRGLDPAFKNGSLMQFLDAKVIKLNSHKSGKGRRTNHSMSAHLFKMKCLQKMILTVLKFWKAYNDKVRNALRENMTRLINTMELFRNPERFGKQQFSDFTNETYRFCHQAQFNYLVLHSGYYNNKTRDDIKQLYDKIKNRLNNSNRYTVATSKENELDLEKLRETVQVAPLISEEEKNMLYSVFPELRNFLYFNRGQGYLYKCPEGHVYFIGNCGQAEVASVCNLCNEKIGGTKHNLLHGSAYDLNQMTHLRPPNVPRPHYMLLNREYDIGHHDIGHRMRDWAIKRRRLVPRQNYVPPIPPAVVDAPATLQMQMRPRDSQMSREIGKEMDFFTRILRESRTKPRCLLSCPLVDRRTIMGDLSWRMRRVVETLRLQRQMQDNALEDLFDDIRYQINAASNERLGELRVAFDRDLPAEVFERGQCFGCMVQGAIPAGVRLTANNVYEVIAHGHCNHPRGVNVPEQVATNGQAAVGPTLEQLKAEILKEVEAKLDTLKPYFNQTPDLEQPGPSGVAAVSSSDPAASASASSTQPAPAVPLADSSDSPASASGPALSCGPHLENEHYDWLLASDEPEEEVSSFTTDSD